LINRALNSGRFSRQAGLKPQLEPILNKSKEILMKPVSVSYRKLILTLGVFMTSQTVCASLRSDFESGTEGWKIVSFADFSANNYSIISVNEPTHNIAGGNPNSYISSLDPDSGDFTFSAPTSFLGNQSGATGLSYDLTHAVGSVNWQMTDVLLVSGSTRLLWNNQPDTVPGDFWTHVNLSFDPSDEWRVNASNGALATAADFQSVLENLTGFYIHGEFTDGLVGVESSGIDNVNLATVPVPSAFWLFSSALAVLGLVRKRG